MEWCKQVLSGLSKTFPHDKAAPNITLKDDHLVFSFIVGDTWYSFGITEEDLKMSPEELVSQVKADLKI